MSMVLLLAALTVGLVDVCKENTTVNVSLAYVRALEKAGHVPLVLPRVADRACALEQVKRVDLVLFCGGEDVDPARYGMAKSPRCEAVNADRDAFEWMILDACVGIRRPVFGICRGEQLINCYFGGTLFQDINTEVAGVGRHRYVPGEKRTHVDHEIEILAGSRLSDVLGAGRVSVKAWHHQAVRKIAPGFRVAARTADGVVEAIESDDYPAAGVQFHPEENVAADPSTRLLEIFRRLDFLCGGGSAAKTPCDPLVPSKFQEGEPAKQLEALKTLRRDFGLRRFVFVAPGTARVYGCYDREIREKIGEGGRLTLVSVKYDMILENMECENEYNDKTIVCPWFRGFRRNDAVCGMSCAVVGQAAEREHASFARLHRNGQHGLGGSLRTEEPS